MTDICMRGRETRAMMWTPQQMQDGRYINYGLGWQLRLTRESATDTAPTATTTTAPATAAGPAPMPRVSAVYHLGGAVGGSTLLLLLPEHGLSVALVTNLQGVKQLLDVGLEVARCFVDV